MKPQFNYPEDLEYIFIFILLFGGLTAGTQKNNMNYPIPYKTKPEYWVSLKTGNKYPYLKYCNHGKGGEYRGFMDLPKDEYPYTIQYKAPLIPKWAE